MPVEIRTLIVDDEPLAREGVRLLLREDPEFIIVGECADGTSTIEAIKEIKPDLVFLDIQMPGLNGFEVLAGLPQDVLPMVVFVSAYDKYAMRAFEIHALDYLLKPVNESRFRDSRERIKRLFVERRTQELTARLVAMLGSVKTSSEQSSASPSHLQRFAVKDADRTYFVPSDEVDWIGAANYYLELHCGKKLHLLRESLNAIERQLNPQVFLRVHRSTIVNINRVREVRRHFGGDYTLVLIDGTQLKTGRSYRQQLDHLLTGS